MKTLLAALLLLAGPALADTITVTYSTGAGSLTATKTISAADTASLLAAYKATATTVDNPSPTNQQAFNAMLSMWLSQTISFVATYKSNQVVPAPIAIQ